MERCAECRRRKAHLCFECSWEKVGAMAGDVDSLIEWASQMVSQMNWLKPKYDDLCAHLHDMTNSLGRIERGLQCSKETPCGHSWGLEPRAGLLVEAGRNGHGVTSGR